MDNRTRLINAIKAGAVESQYIAAEVRTLSAAQVDAECIRLELIDADIFSQPATPAAPPRSPATPQAAAQGTSVANAATALAAALAAMQATPTLDPEEIKAIAREELTRVSAERASELRDTIATMIAAAVKPTIERVYIDRIAGTEMTPTLEIEPALAKTLIDCYESAIAVWVYGPAGTGKTTAAQWLAQATDSRFLSVILSEDSGSEMLGSRIPNLQTGAVIFEPSEMLKRYASTTKEVILIDEITNANAGATKALNGMIQGDPIYFGGIEYRKGADVYIMAADNTKGTGRTVGMAAAQQQDASLLNRFRRVAVDYPLTVEARIFPDWINDVAKRARKIKAERSLSAEFSMRQMSRIARLAEKQGKRDAVIPELTDFPADTHSEILRNV